MQYFTIKELEELEAMEEGVAEEWRKLDAFPHIAAELRRLWHNESYVKKLLERPDPRSNETIYVRSWSSRCGYCGKDCDPQEQTHQKVLGYGDHSKEVGCGVKWVYITTEYTGKRDEEATRQMRPDLIFWNSNPFNLE